MLKSEILISKFETSTNVQNINLSKILENLNLGFVSDLGFRASILNMDTVDQTLMAIPIQCRRDIP
jgi:hypothetical protein